MKILYDFVQGFLNGVYADSISHQETIRNYLNAEKKLRQRLTEKQIDKMIADSFPASDSPSTY